MKNFYLSLPALCGSGAMRLLENGVTLLEMMVGCMERSQPHSVRMEAFKLAQCLAVITVTCSLHIHSSTILVKLS